MKKNIIAIFTVLLFFNLVSITHSATINISGGGYNQISTAMAAGNPGDIIVITDNNIYYEDTISPSVTDMTIKGKGAKPTIIEYLTLPVSPVFDFNSVASNSVLENLKIIITNKNTEAINLSSVNNITLKDLEIIGPGRGISMAPAIDNDQSSDTKIIGCKIYGFNHGIFMNTGGGGPTYAKIFYNIITDCAGGIEIGSFQGENHIYNNTIINNNYGLTIFDSYVMDQNNRIYNNIIYNNYVNDIRLSGSAMTYRNYFNNNCYQTYINNNPSSALAYFANNLNLNPQFDITKNDYSLLSTSPCIDAGYPIDYCQYNFCFFNDLVKNECIDIGAKEHGTINKTFGNYTTLSANNLTIGKSTTITISDLTRITDKNINVKAVIYDLNSKIVKELHNSTVPSSSNITLTWNGKDSNNEYLGAGIYLLKVYLGTIEETKKIFFIP